MPKARDLTNEKFGLLTVIKRAPSRNGHTYWVCKCDCGNEKEIQTSHLTCGITKSCGCQCVNNLKNVPSNSNRKKNITQEQICPICQQKFINRQNSRKYCYNCIPESVPPDKRQWYKQRAFKSTLVKYKGGKCEICGYNKCEGALEFHHIDPTTKDKTISQWNFNYDLDINIFLKEVDKCQLLCANCHREQHYKQEMA